MAGIPTVRHAPGAYTGVADMTCYSFYPTNSALIPAVLLYGATVVSLSSAVRFLQQVNPRLVRAQRM